MTGTGLAGNMNVRRDHAAASHGRGTRLRMGLPSVARPPPENAGRPNLNCWTDLTSPPVENPGSLSRPALSALQERQPVLADGFGLNHELIVGQPSRDGIRRAGPAPADVTARGKAGPEPGTRAGRTGVAAVQISIGGLAGLLEPADQVAQTADQSRDGMAIVPTKFVHPS
jgi:hypothetical protein